MQIVAISYILLSASSNSRMATIKITQLDSGNTTIGDSTELEIDILKVDIKENAHSDKCCSFWSHKSATGDCE